MFGGISVEFTRYSRVEAVNSALSPQALLANIKKKQQIEIVMVII